MPEKTYVAPEGTTAKQIIELMEGTGYDKRMQVWYDQYTEMGLLREVNGERNFINEALVRFKAYEPNYLFLMVASRKSKVPVKREIQKLVRMKGPDGKEYIRFSARFSTQNKLGEEISATMSPIGYWEEPVFRKVYDAKEMEWIDTLEMMRTIPHYEIAWTPEKIKELSKEFVEFPKFMIEDKDAGHTKKYVIDGDTWRTKPRQEIIKLEKEKEHAHSAQAVKNLADAIKMATDAK
jgi:hypothetical protein